MENFIAIFSITILILNICMIILLGFLSYQFHFIKKNYEDTSKDLAEVMTKLMSYLQSEFSNNFDVQKQMQEWTEKAFDITSENFSKLANSQHQTQMFLNRMAEGMGLSTRSNLDDV